MERLSSNAMRALIEAVAKGDNKYNSKLSEKVPATPRVDSHAITAAEMFSVPLHEVTAEMRAYGRLSNNRALHYFKKRGQKRASDCG